ncbi:hypothetical protein [Streptomyces justiciae]|uniref:Uncharacterized protein n=1 Tax=Streptomyces justiciae TaxID=2780140 RepID=A0ABU3M098_9ACTN|nr:hypothetical protein [Streptomyces justiciae]MDT7844203.1 hypothetical protein [Streptomyces justiciae]
MLSEALTALAAAGGTAVAQAAGTDTWTSVRQRTARLFGRGEEPAVLGELDRTEQELAHGGSREEAAARWAERFVRLLRDLDAGGRAAVVEELRRLEGSPPPTPASGPVFHGDVTVRADQGVAGAVVNGPVRVENPRSPGRSQG